MMGLCLLQMKQNMYCIVQVDGEKESGFLVLGQ